MPLTALPKSLQLLEAIVADGGRSSISALARVCALPVATAHRHAAALEKAGWIVPAGYGRHLAGPRLRAIAGMIDDKLIITGVAAPILDQLADRTGCVVQLGTFEQDMVTYRLKTGRGAGDLFTKVGMQLEAYCSGIGKVLLAHLPAAEQAAYLATGPFIALTDRTITDPARLKAELDRVARLGFALDDEEVAPGLQCVAVPVHNAQGRVIAAISASRVPEDDGEQEKIIPLLKAAAKEISERAA
jgi:IclR family acetate operon transcriptional repressor